MVCLTFAHTVPMIRSLALMLCLAGGLQPLTAQFRTLKRSGDSAYDLGAYEQAEQSYREALAVRPDDTDVLARLGDIYRMQNELDSARSYYERATVNRRAEPATLLAYAQTLKSLGDYSAARPLFLTYAQEGEQQVGSHYAATLDFAVTQRDEAAGFQVVPAPFSTGGAEFGPAYVPGGGVAFNRAGPLLSDSTLANEPYVVQPNSLGNWEPARSLGVGLQGRGGSVGPVSYNAEGTEVLFTRNTFAPGMRMVPHEGLSLSLLIAEVNEAGGWYNVRPLPVNGSGFSTGYGTFSPDGQTIYFASNRPGGVGEYDLYRTRRVNGEWEAVPENLGTVVNSAGNEITPFFDGKDLYFASDWHMGLGAYDVFRAELNAAERPASLYHLGGRVNSSRDDYGFIFTPSEQAGYLVSNRIGGRGSERIYAATFTERPLVAEPTGELAGETLATGPLATVPTGVVDGIPPPFGTVRGYVSNVEDGTPVAEATVTITKRATGQAATARTDVEGAYYVAVEPATVYDVEVEVPGFEATSFPVTTTGEPAGNAFGNIPVLPIQAEYTAVTPPEPTVQPRTSASDSPAEADRADPPTPSVDPAASEAYSIQVASLRAEPDPAAYQKLAAIGPVQVVAEAGSFKVRVGAFATHAAATARISEVAALGYPGSFVTKGRVESSVALEDTPYRVQLGAFRDPSTFDRQGAAALGGTLDSEVRGGLTVFYVDLASLEAARAVQQRAQQQGLTGAYILRRTPDGYDRL